MVSHRMVNCMDERDMDICPFLCVFLSFLVFHGRSKHSLTNSRASRSRVKIENNAKNASLDRKDS